MAGGDGALPYLPPAQARLPINQNDLPATDPLLAEAAALQIGSASLSSYGTLPNPQAVVEAASTGAASTVAAAAQAGDPLFQAELGGTPAGQAMNTGSPTAGLPPASSVTAPTAPIWDYNPKTDAQTQANLLKDPLNASWTSLGMVPELNMGWLAAQRTANPNVIKKWQGYLQNAKFYQPGDGVSNHVNGVWDAQTESAMQSLLIARALPDALYNPDPTKQTNAGLFLNSLGFDWTTMQNNLRDPTVQAQVAQQWGAAQGPNPGSTPVSNLQAYANEYGVAALPQSYQDILHPSFIDSLRSTITGAPLIGLLNDIPGVSTAFHAVTNVLTGDLDPGNILQDPRAIEAKKVNTEAQQLDHLTGSEITAMNPLLDEVKQNSGWLGFMSQWDHERNAIFLSLGLVAKELFTGTGATTTDPVTGKQTTHHGWENPFDLSSGSNAWVQAHADNMASAIFGDNWAQNNPALAGIFNFAVNTADDPLSYFNIVGDSEKVQSFMNIRSIEKLVKDPETRAALHNLTATSTRELANKQFFTATRAAYKQKTMSLPDALDVFGGTHVGSMAQAHHDLVDKILNEPDESKAWELFTKGDEKHKVGFAYNVNSGKVLYNQRAAWNGLAQVKSQKMLGKFRVMMGLGDQGSMDLLKGPEHAMKVARDYLTLVEMPVADQIPLLEDFYRTARQDTEGWKAQAAMQDLENKVVEQMEKKYGVTKADLDKHAGFVQRSRQAMDYGESGKLRGKEQTTTYMPAPSSASHQEAVQHGEQSIGPKTFEPGPKREAELNALDRLYMEREVAVRSGNKDLIDHVDGEINLYSRPVPATITQLAGAFRFRYTPYEIATAKMKIFRASERVQGNMRLDAYMGIWRRWTLARVSTALRLTLGDDTIRPFTLLVNMGHPITAMHYLGNQLGRSIAIAMPGMPKWLLDLGNVEHADVLKEWRAEQKLTEERRAEIALEKARDEEMGIKAKVPNKFGRVLEKVPIGPRQRVIKQYLDIIGGDKDMQSILQDFSLLDGRLSVHTFRPFVPGGHGYVRALSDVINYHWRQDPMIQTWLKAFRRENPGASSKAILDYVTGITEDDPNYNKVRQWLYAQGGGDGDHIRDARIISRWDGWMQETFQHPALRRMAQTSADENALRKLSDSAWFRSKRVLPTISARPEAGDASNAFVELLNKYPTAVFERITAPMVDSARANGMMAVKKVYERQIRNYFKGDPKTTLEDWDQHVDQESTARAIDWVRNNTYQGGRSILGGTVRNVMPFYGAATNMDRFFFRQALAHPWVGGAALRAASASQASPNAGNVNPSTNLLGMLAHTGFGGGEGISFDPLHAFFLTSDGLGSFVPGTGPIFAPVWSGVARIPGLAEVLSNVPGVNTQIDYATGDATPEFPWIGDLIQGSYMALTGGQLNVPLLTNTANRTTTLIDDKIQQWDRNKQGSGPGGQVAAADQAAITREVGRDELLQGALQYAVPMTPSVTDTTAQAQTQALDNWRAQTTDAGKDQVTSQQLGISVKKWQDAINQVQGAETLNQLVQKDPNNPGVLMAYEDSRLSPEDRDAIATLAPWVMSAASSKYQYTTSQSPASLQQWNLMQQLGQVQALQPFGDESTPTFTGKIAKEADINSGWVQYDYLKNLEFSQLQQNGWTTQSPLYSQWKAAYFDPQVIKMQQSNPEWWKQFSSGGDTSSAPGLAAVSAPLRTLMTWEVIPQHPDMETPQSVLWRNAVALAQQAGNAMYSLKVSGGSSAEQDLILQSLQQQLQNLAAMDPTFAAQLAGYRFSKWEDVVNLEADEMAAQATLTGSASIPTVQP